MRVHESTHKNTLFYFQGHALKTQHIYEYI